MINKILTILGAIIGLFSYGYFKGKQSEKDKAKDKAIKTIQKAQNTKIDIAKLSRRTKRMQLRPTKQ